MFKKIVFVLIALFLAEFAVATSPCSAGDLERAKAEFSQGVELFSKEDYSGALEAFERSYEITPRASTLFNIAMCQKALGMNEQAAASFERFLKDSKLEPGNPMLVDAQAALEELKALAQEQEKQEPPAMVRIEPVDQPEPVEIVDQTNMEDSASEEDDKSSLATAELSAEKRDEGSSALLVTGIVTGGLGLAAVGVGAYFTVEYFKDFDRGESAASECNESYNTDCAETYANIEEKELPADTMGQAISYVAGGVLIATGVTLILIDWKKRRGGEKGAVSVLPTPGGVVVRF